MILKTKTRTLGYFFAVLLPVLTSGVLFATWPAFEQTPFVVFLYSVAAASWLGGLRPGLVSLILSLLLANTLFVQPYYAIGPLTEDQLFRVLFVLVVGLIVAFAGEKMHRARRGGRDHSQAPLTDVSISLKITD